MKYDIFSALINLRPNEKIISWDGNGYEGITCDNCPTKEELEAELARLNSQLYKEDRKEAYPDWGTQLDYIYHHGIDKWKTDIVDPIKKKYPKPE